MRIKYFVLISLVLYRCDLTISESCAKVTGEVNQYLRDNILTQYQITYVKTKFNLDQCLCDKQCLRKCCATGYSFSEMKKMCVLDELNVYRIREYVAFSNIVDQFDYIPGIRCKDYYYQDPFKNPKDDFVIVENGSMHLVHHDVFVDPNEYCFEYFENKGICGILCFPSEDEYLVSTDLKPIGKKVKHSSH